MTRVLVTPLALFALGVVPAFGQVQTFPNDYAGFVNASGPLSVIDFETLPNGQPSFAGTPITDTFNYDAFGAHFSAPVPRLLIAGNPVSGFSLTADTFPNNLRTWIIADMMTPARSVGVFFGGGTQMCAFDDEGSQIGCVAFGGGGVGFFVGLVSATPIAQVRIDRGSSFEDIQAFVFSPVPEPCTSLLLGCGLVWIIRRAKRTCLGVERAA